MEEKQNTASAAKNSLVAAYQSQGKKTKFGVLVFLILLPIFSANKIINVMGHSDDRLLEHCKAVTAKTEKEAYDGEYQLACRTSLHRAGLKMRADVE